MTPPAQTTTAPADTTAARVRELTALDFRVFPARTKTQPCIKEWPEKATSDPEAAAKLFKQFPNGRVSIYTGTYRDGALLVIDIDPPKCERPASLGAEVKGTALAKAVARELIKKYELPNTRAHSTPSGGLHLIFKVPAAITGKAHALGRGIDTRSDRQQIHFGDNYSHIAGTPSEPADATEALIAACAGTKTAAAEQHLTKAQRETPLVDLDQPYDIARAIDWLKKDAPPALEGQGGEYRTLLIAMDLRDQFALSEPTAYDLMLEHYNPRCEPPWEPEDLQTKVSNAWKYARNAPGTNHPQAQFKPNTLDGAEQWDAKTIREKIKTGDFELAAKADPAGAERVEQAWDLLHIVPEEIGQVREIVQRAKLANVEPHALDKLFGNCAYVASLNQIVRDVPPSELADLPKGTPSFEFLDVGAFHNKFAPNQFEGKPASKVWMAWPKRRDYDRTVFLPGQRTARGNYNLWRGFSYEPAPAIDWGSQRGRDAVAAWREHLLENVAQGNQDHANWITAWLAHIVQKPAEKPQIALVLRGGKGVGKNAVLERVGELFGRHFVVADDNRYLVGNFNRHLEHCLFIVFDEAFWSGDKKAEGRLKGLITGTDHIIEPKGKEAYKARNLTRVAIIGNEEWLVPASDDERRYAVFDVGEGRKQQARFFREMREGMEADNGAGYRLLLRYLLDFDLSLADLDQGPSTQALIDQKHQSLGLVQSWWLACLHAGSIVSADFEGWPDLIETDRLRHAFFRYVNEHRMGRTWLPSPVQIGRDLRKCAGIVAKNARRGELWAKLYVIPPLDECRNRWEGRIGGAVNWGSED